MDGNNRLRATVTVSLLLTRCGHETVWLPSTESTFFLSLMTEMKRDQLADKWKWWLDNKCFIRVVSIHCFLREEIWLIGRVFTMFLKPSPWSLISYLAQSIFRASESVISQPHVKGGKNRALCFLPGATLQANKIKYIFKPEYETLITQTLTPTGIQINSCTLNFSHFVYHWDIELNTGLV